MIQSVLEVSALLALSSITLVGVRLVRTLDKLRKGLVEAILVAELDVTEAKTIESIKLLDSINGITDKLDAIFVNSDEEVKYVPLEDFMTEKLLEDAQNDFDNSELVFEWEL